MSKGMSLEELRNNLEGDAQKKVQTLEERVKQLEKEKQDLLTTRNGLRNDIVNMEKESYYLFNRCRALSQGTMCQFCGLRYRCCYIRNRYADPKIEKVTDAIVNGTINDLAEEMLTQMCEQIKEKYETEHPEVLNSVGKE